MSNGILDLKKMVPIHRGIPVIKSDIIPKTKTVRDDDGNPVMNPDGSTQEVEVLCWKIFDEIHVHPDNWDKFSELLNKVKEEP